MGVLWLPPSSTDVSGLRRLTKRLSAAGGWERAEGTWGAAEKAPVVRERWGGGAEAAPATQHGASE